MSLTIGIFIFEGMTQLDATGPFEALSRISGSRVLLVAKRRRMITAEFGLSIRPHTELRHCPKLDVLCIPGGSGVNALLLDEEVIAFIQRRARHARFVTSVCTGSLVLGAAGLLRGRKAACHWLSLPLLKIFGAKPSSKRIERDGKFVTAGGITSGIDFGLWLAAELAGRSTAEKIQLMMQYDPQPPFQAGRPELAGSRVVQRIVSARRTFQAERAALAEKAAARLAGAGRRRASH